MDIIDRHFAAENAHDVEGTLATYTDDIVWDDVTHPDAPFHGKEEVGAVYSSIIDAIPDVFLKSVKRFRSEDGSHVVDESVLSGHVHGQWSGMDGGGAPITVRILHIFELREGLISYENAWFDASAVARQIQSWKQAPILLVGTGPVGTCGVASGDPSSALVPASADVRQGLGQMPT